MRAYEVQPGDSPAKIAIQFAGCPKCAIDLVRANPHKPTTRFPNGFVSFREMHPGERLNLPDKWFNGDLDSRPPMYFMALPYADGLTSSTLGDAAAGVLGDYAALDAATAKVDALTALDNASFANAAPDAGSAIDAAVKEAYGSANQTAAQYAQSVQNATQYAWQQNGNFASLLPSGDATSLSILRQDIQTSLSTALSSARLALQAYYTQPAPAAGFSAMLVSAAQAAAAAIAADSSYCTSVARPGTGVNSAVHAFKTAWNASQSSPVPINTGNYEAPTATALGRVLGTAPTACGAAPASRAPAAPLRIAPTPTVLVAAAPKAPGLSTGAVVGIGLLGAAAVGGIAYASTRKPAARGRRRR